MAKRIVVGLPGEADYDVRIGPAILGEAGADMREVERLAQVDRALVVTDSNVGPRYLAQTKSSLVRAGFTVSDITVKAGETSKALAVAEEIWRAMAQLGLGRDSVVVALGGGVVGDLAGYVAASYMRGVPVVQIPTTLLAMVDSSVGGKTAVNLPEGKNLVGAFWQPVYVCADTEVLATLPAREWRCGCGEIAKSAAICSDDFFFWLMEHAAALAVRDAAATAEAIARSVVFKADVVAQDKTESAGVRECLNYGHTLAHAIEACAGYGTFSHGEAVAEGMRFAARLAQDQQGASSDFVAAQNSLLDALGLAPLVFDASPEDLLAAMMRDKKVRAGALRFVLARDVADWSICELPGDTVLAYLEQR